MDYSKYKFNYFDVIKRHERIINRPKDWEVKVLAFIMLLVTFFFVFSSNILAHEEETLNYQVANNLRINPNSNYFVGSDGRNVGYVVIEKGYIYKFYNNNTGDIQLHIAVSDEAPQVNGTYTFLATVPAGESYSYIGDGNYMYFDFTHWANIQVTREKIANYEGAVTDLVDNVGVNQIWGVFENGVSFVGVVVLVAFGLFLVVLAIKKVSKGKSEF